MSWNRLVQAARKTFDEINGITKICVPRLLGVVKHGSRVIGMLFQRADEWEFLSEKVVATATDDSRDRWCEQLQRTLGYLHRRQVAWVDARLESVMLDNQGDVWITNIGRVTPNLQDGPLAFEDLRKRDLEGLEHVLAQIQTGRPRIESPEPESPKAESPKVESTKAKERPRNFLDEGSEDTGGLEWFDEWFAELTMEPSAKMLSV